MIDKQESKPILSFVIPCYRSEHTISDVIDRIIATVNSDERYDYEIICVNDCSPDSTIHVLTEAAEKNQHITVVDLMRNFGQHAALMAGFGFVNGDIVICLDDDGQTMPEEVFKLIDKLNEGFDVVSAKYPVKKESLFRRLGSWTAVKVSEQMVGKPKGVLLNSYFVMRRIVLDEILKYPNPYPNIQGLFLRVTRKIGNVEIEHQERKIGKSGYNFIKLLSLWMNGFTSFSEKPLRISSFLGFFCFFGGIIFGTIVVIRKLLNPEIMLGYSSIMAVMLFMFGIILLMLGLMGEYIGRIYICINKAPQYVVRSVKNQHNYNRPDNQEQP